VLILLAALAGAVYGYRHYTRVQDEQDLWREATDPAT
jgi:uncharacterized membrane protein YpjA